MELEEERDKKKLLEKGINKREMKNQDRWGLDRKKEDKMEDSGESKRERKKKRGKDE